MRINLSDGRRILDANANAEVDDRAIDALRDSVWNDLQLTDNENGFELKFDERVAAFESNETTNYHVYWSLRNSQADPANYDPTHRVTLSESERSHFDGDHMKIDEEESRRTEEYRRLHAEQGGRTTSYDSGFSYTATSDERSDTRSSMKQRTEDELANTRSRAFLESSDTELTLEAPNIQGRFVSLNAHGGTGNYRVATHITLPINHNGVITLEEQVAIDAAEPGDLIYLSTVPTKTDVSLASSYVFGKSWAEDGYAVGQSIYLEADEITGPPTYTIGDIGGSHMFLDRVSVENVVSAPVFIARVADDVDQATHLVVQRRDDIDVDAGVAVMAESAAGDVFLGSESDIPLLSVNAGTAETPGRVQIKAKGSVVDVIPNPSEHPIPNIMGGRIEIESADGHIGAAGKPIRLWQLEGGSQTVRADDEVVIRNTNETKLGELHVDQILSRKSFVSLTADNSSIVDAFDSDQTSIKAHDIRIAACQAIGEEGNALDIDAAPDGMVTARSEHGTICLNETDGNLNIESTRPGSVLTADGRVIDLSKRVIGDSNHDGVFDSSDLVAVFQADEYQDDIDGNSTWEEGDWNGDGDFTTSDLVAAFSAGTYRNPNPPTHPVEPAETEELRCTVLPSGSDTAGDSLTDGNVLGNFDGDSDTLGDGNLVLDGGAGDNVLINGLADSNVVEGDFDG